MFDYVHLTKTEFLVRNRPALKTLIDRVNQDLFSQYGSALQPLTEHDFWLVFFAEAAIDGNGHIDPGGRHSLGERGVLPLPSNISFWVGPGAPDPKQPHALSENLTFYARYLAQLKNKVVLSRGGRDIYPGLFRHPGISGSPARTAKVLAGVVHGYFFGGNYSSGPAPDDLLLDGYSRDLPIPDMMRGTSYVHAGTTILDNRQRNVEVALKLIERHISPDGLSGMHSAHGDIDGRYELAPSSGNNLAAATLRIDVDGPTAQNLLSLEVVRGFPQELTHVIARIAENGHDGSERRIVAVPIYQAGEAWIVEGDRFVVILDPFNKARLEIERAGVVLTEISFVHASSFFDQVEFEVDVVEDAGRVHDAYDPQSHPNRPPGLSLAPVSIERAFREAGFDADISSERSIIPFGEAGTNGTWSNSELHNAMQEYWSRFDHRAQWGMWVIYAALHDDGDGLGGIMFDSIGNNHRQGTAIFTNSFIARAPFGETNPEAWRRRMQIWTAIHEIGHGFNLAHSWQKDVGTAFPLTAVNEPEARSFMNYPYDVSGGQEAFFSDFEFRFSNQELLFMRHAPRHFVQMGGAHWGMQHGLEEPRRTNGQPLRLEIRPNRGHNVFSFLEPVHLELKLSNVSGQRLQVPKDVLTDQHHLAIAVARDGAERTKRHRPFATACMAPLSTELEPGGALYEKHFVGASADGWLIDEPGFYSVQAAVSYRGETIISNVLRIYVDPGRSADAHKLAPDFFNSDVGRVLAFHGAPQLQQANNVLQEVVDRIPDEPVANHARLGLAGTLMSRFKHLHIREGENEIRVETMPPDLDQAMRLQQNLVNDQAQTTAETLGHIQYRESTETLARSFAETGALEEAAQVQTALVNTLEARQVLPSVVRDARALLGLYRGGEAAE